MYDDIEYLSQYVNFDYKEKRFQKSTELTIHDIGDNVYCNGEYNYYGYCPRINGLHHHKDCAFCKYNNYWNFYCKYRFRDLLKNEITSVEAIERDDEGRILKLEVIIDETLHKYLYNQLEYNSKPIPELLSIIPKAKAVRFYNTNNMNKVQMNMKNINKLKKYNQCYGRLCKASDWNNYSKNEYPIFDYEKPIWVISWYVEGN